MGVGERSEKGGLPPYFVIKLFSVYLVAGPLPYILAGSSRDMTLNLLSSSLLKWSKGLSAVSLATYSLSSTRNFSAKQSCMKSGCWSNWEHVGRISGSIRRHWDKKSKLLELQPGRWLRNERRPPLKPRAEFMFTKATPRYERLSMLDFRIPRPLLLFRFTRLWCLWQRPPLWNVQSKYYYG